MTASSDAADAAPEAGPALAGGFPRPERAQWLALVETVLKGAAFEKRLVSGTADGIAVQPLYTRGDAAVIEGAVPGAAPFVRGSALRAAAGGWRVATLHAEADPGKLAAALAEDAAGGAQAATIRIAAPGQHGLPADHAALDAALGALLPGRMQLSLEPGARAIDAGLALATIAKTRGAPGAIGRLGIDPLGVLASTGELILLKKDGSGFVPGLPWQAPPTATLTVDTQPYHEAGASEAQELAALAATLIAYLRAAEGEGQSPDRVLPRIALNVASDADLFISIAKLRAARRLAWQVAEACGAGETAGRMALIATTSERMMTRRDPWVNMLRVTAACTAAALGGADEIAVLPFTWALGQPDAFARRIARNVGVVLGEESGLGRIVDPAGGSWYVDQLSDELAQKAWSLMQEWEAEGGMQAALTSGLVRDQIAAVAAGRDKAIATRRQELTGASAFAKLGEDGVTVEPWPAAPALPASPVARPLPRRRLAAAFEHLRDVADAQAKPLRVFLASLGTPAEHGARSTWITNLLAAGGIGVIASEGFTSSTDAGRVFAESGASVACICSSDAVYGELAEATAMALKAAGATRVDLAGRPREQEASLKAAGVDTFIVAGADAVEILGGLQRALGVAA